jgi:hypothetical protein
METSLMSESVVNAGDVEESVTQVLTHFVQGGGDLLCCNKNEKGSSRVLYD